jgi:hypothetical protein
MNYENFIKVNAALAECYQATAPKDYEKMSVYEKEILCKDQRDKVQDIFRAGDLKIEHLFKQRLDNL